LSVITMSIEREIKLSLPREHVDAARALLTELAGRDGETMPLANVYYDTPERTLARAKSALRLRRTPGGWVQTLKFGGGARQGVHSRHEWEMAVAGEALDFDTLFAHCDDPRAVDALREAAQRVEPLFRTDLRDRTRVEGRIGRGGPCGARRGRGNRESACAGRRAGQYQ
jgi:triphosphatase